MKQWRIVLVYLCALSVSSCGIIKNHSENLKNLSRCRFEFVNAERKVSFSEPTANLWNYVISLNFQGINPNDVPVRIGSYRLDLFVNDRYLTQINTNGSIILAPQSSTDFCLKAVIAPNAALSLFWKKLRKKRIEYRTRHICKFVQICGKR
jgi:LEA14-like dessication related protein